MRPSIPLSILLLVACSDDRSAGTGSQTGNSVVAGMILLADSTTPAKNDTVFLKTATWTGDSDDVAPRYTLTDSAGNFRFEDVAPGHWLLHSRNMMSGWMSRVQVIAGRDTVVPTGRLQKLGRIAVTVELNDFLRYAGILCVLGLSETRKLHDLVPPGTRSFSDTITGVPPGERKLVIKNAQDSVLLETHILVLPDSMAVIPAREWEAPDGDDDLGDDH